MLKLRFKLFFKLLLTVYALLLVFAWGFSDSLIFLPPPASYTKSDDVILLQSSDAGSGHSHQIAASYRVNPSARYTILYNHGNAVDLGGLKKLQQKFYQQGYSVMLYDYSGYGLSEGAPSEDQLYHDSQAAYDYLVNIAGVSPGQIIIYGHSLGSAVALDLATRRKARALVLESPFTTAFQVETGFSIVPFDKFNNIDKIATLHLPLLILHSKDDAVVPFSHGVRLFDRANEPKHFLEFSDAGHNGITHAGQRFWRPFKAFVSSL